MNKQIELERNEMSEILAQNFALNDQKFDASDFEWSAHCLQMAGFHKTEWISVEERLPERSGKYLVATFDGRVGIGNLIDYYCDGDLSFDNYKVTHWMPLPMPPKGDVGR